MNEPQKILNLIERPDFLPEGLLSTAELRRVVCANIGRVLDLVPQAEITKMTIAEIENLPAGCYLLPETPSVQLLQELPNFRNGASEVGIICIQGKWLISTAGDETRTEWPQLILAAQSSGSLQMDLHSHPGDDERSRLPSFRDIHNLRNTADGKIYIACSTGLIEIVWRGILPGGYKRPTDIDQSWKYWILHELQLTREEYEHTVITLEQEFYKQNFSMRTISWTDTEKIMKLISEKQLLQAEA